MAAVIDVEQFPVTDRVEFLREHMLSSPVPLVLEPHRDADIVVRSRVADLGAVHLLCTKAGGADVVRSPRLARDGTRPSLMMSVVDHGSATIVRGEDVTHLHPGDIGLYATAEPYRIAFSAGAERLTYQVPLDRLGLPWDLVRRQLTTAVHPDTATGAAVSAFLRTTARHAPDAGAPEQASLERSTLELARLLLTRVVAGSEAGRAAAGASLATRVEEHVRARLGDADLGAASIARTFSISERYVYLVLARRGVDLGEMIREHRLARAARMLADPAGPDRTLAAIAHDCGFADHSHFSRAFRARFGTTPSEWRRAARP